MSAPLDRPAGFRGSFLDHPDDTAPYSGASGILAARPAAVAVPRDAADVQALVRWAAAAGTPLVPRGAGTGMPGGNVGSGVVVDLVGELRAIGPIDLDHRAATVQPGATLGALNRLLAPHDLHFPVDPSSGERCTLGGMIANNSAGAHSVLHGATRPWVQALDLVWADGSRSRLARGEPPEGAAAAFIERVDDLLRGREEWIAAVWPRVRKNSSGYALREYLASGDAIDLLIGSEGTLGITVGAELRLHAVAAARGVALLEFASLEAAGDAVRALLPLRPATCEMLDRTFLELVRAGGGDGGYPIRAGLEAILLVEVEGADEAEVRRGLDAVRDTVAGVADEVSVALEPERQHAFWAVRHAASPIIAAQADGRVSMQFIEDGVVPIDRLPDYVRLLREVLHRHHLPAVIFGHAGDGNLHVNPLVDVTAPRWRESLHDVLLEIAAGVARLGGTLAGEHGDGRLRAPLLPVVWGDEMVALFRGVKEIFDPAGILNPGVILPRPGQHPFEGLRY